MFGRKAHRIKKLEETLQRLTAASDETLKHARLFDIEKNGRSLSFLFYKSGEVYRVETLSPLSFDVVRVKRDLLP